MSISYKEYNEKYRLPEQARDEKLLLSKKHFCLCYEPGKGKSYPVIHCMQVVNKMKGGKASVLILSDATCIKDMWRAEIQPQGVLPKDTYMVTDRTAIGAVKEALLKKHWDIIVCDECFHPTTEILTAQGWVRFDQLKGNEEVAQYHDDGSIDFVKPLRHIVKSYEGPLHIMSTNGKVFKVTPNHMMVYNGITEKAKYHNTDRPLIVSGKVSGVIDTLSFRDRLAIACQADGCSHPPTQDGNQQWDFKFTKARKREAIEELLTQLNLSWKSGKYYGQYYVKIPTDWNITKDLTTYFTTLKDKSSAWCDEFIKEESKWDGHIDDKGRFYYSSTNINNVKLIEAILCLNNKKFNTSKIVDTRWSKPSISYRVQSSNIIIDNRAHRSWSTEQYSGKVYCVEVPTHKIVVRSPDGTAIVCGNCQSLRSGVTRAKSQYAKLVYQLAKRTEYVWGMTGTIAGNNNIEPFCVLHNLHVAGCGDINCHKFKAMYCVQELCYGPFGSFQKPTKLNENGEFFMQRAYAAGCSFWDYDDNDEMPPMEVEFKSFTVPVTETYKNALDGILKCGETESTVLKAIAIQKAQQALNGFIYYNDEDVKRQTFQVPEFKNPKLDYVLSECQKQNCIIGYRFQEDGYYVEKTLNDAGIATTRKINEFKLRAPNERIILVLQCQRGKAANLQMCQRIIYYTADFSYIAYRQFIHRTWRRGQTKPCKVTFLCNDPGDPARVERKIWDSLRAKNSIHETLMSIKRDYE